MLGVVALILRVDLELEMIKSPTGPFVMGVELIRDRFGDVVMMGISPNVNLTFSAIFGIIRIEKLVKVM